MLRAHLDREVHNGLSRMTGKVLNNNGVLESSRVGTARGRIDLSSQGAGTVLVNLVEGHGDDTVIVGGGETLGGTLTSTSSNTSTSSTSGSASSTTQKGSDSGSNVNRTATLGTATNRRLATHLISADNRGISLRAREGVDRATRSTDTGHVSTARTPTLRDDTVGRDEASKSSGNEGDRVTHFGSWLL